MAHLLRRPFQMGSQAAGLRAFTTSARLAAGAGPKGPKAMAMPRQAAEPSVRLALKGQGKIQSDLGILPDTFIAPTGSNLPSLFSKDYFSLRYHQYKRHAQDLFVMAIYRITNRTDNIRINFSKTAPTAKALHQSMYTAFADKDLSTLKRICCGGLYDSFVARITARPKGERWEWKIVKYTKRAKVMSNRAASLMVDRAGIRQAVVRICSQQQLTRYRPDGSIVPGTGEVREVEEYIVIQRTLWQGVEGPWMVWGTTEETTIDKVREAQAEALGQ